MLYCKTYLRMLFMSWMIRIVAIFMRLFKDLLVFFAQVLPMLLLMLAFVSVFLQVQTSVDVKWLMKLHEK